MGDNIIVSLSTFDRSVSIINLYNTYKNRKISEQILVQQRKSNIHLADMKNQLKVANETNRRILVNQIKQEKLREEQKFYKALSYNANEIIEQLENITDPMVLNYLLNGLYDKTKNSLLEANDTLEEINDKIFSKQILGKLNEIKAKAEICQNDYADNVLGRIDNLLLDLKQKKDEISNIKKPNIGEIKIKDKWENNSLRIFGIIVLGFLSLIIFLFLFIDNSKTEFLTILVIFLVFSIPLTLIIIQDNKWRKGFSKYKMDQNKKRERERNRTIEIEKVFNQKIQKHQEMLLQHPAFYAMQEINIKHPTFEIITTNFLEIEKTFLNKWGIIFEK